MASGEIHVGDIGTAFRLTVRDEDNAIVDLSGASSLLMLFKKPSATVVEKTASTTSGGTDGRMEYVTASGDLDEDGFWKWQGRVHFPGSSGTFSTDIMRTRVYPNLDSEA